MSSFPEKQQKRCSRKKARKQLVVEPITIEPVTTLDIKKTKIIVLSGSEQQFADNEVAEMPFPLVVYPPPGTTRALPILSFLSSSKF